MNRKVLVMVGALLAALSLAGCAANRVQTLGSTNCQRLAQAGDSKIQIYCRAPVSDRVWPLEPTLQSAFLVPAARQTAAGETCRRLTRLSADGIRTVCASKAAWDEFDSWAVGADVTCRWNPIPGRNVPPELCMTAAQWQASAVARRRSSGAIPNVGSGWGGSGSTGESGFGYATSYGFSSNGVIGQ